MGRRGRGRSGGRARATGRARQGVRQALDQARGFEARGQLAAAQAACEQAVGLAPGEAAAWQALGRVALRAGDARRAVEALARAATLAPTAAAHNNLGMALLATGCSAEAEAAFRQALALDADYGGAHLNLGCVLRGAGRPGEACVHFERAVALAPDDPAALGNLAAALMERGEIDRALAVAERIEALPDVPAALGSNALMVRAYAEALAPEAVAAAHRTWARRTMQALPATPPGGTLRPRRGPRRPLIVGYLSPDLCDHSVAHFIEPVLAAHDRERVRVLAYANVERPDAVTVRLRALVDAWCDASGLPDDRLAARIGADGVDVLVDLAGHTGGNRLGVLARRAAPVQVTWLGYPNTTGLDVVDWRLTDAIADPPGATEALHSERLWRLPGGFLCYRPPERAPEPVVGDRGTVTFGSFNVVSKLSPRTVEAWAAILRAVPAARLLLKAAALADRAVCERLRSVFAEGGVDPARLELVSWLPDPADHLGLYRRVDIALDPLHYNGTTTTCEALWMGVPVVTCAGRAHSARVGASLLHRVGLDDVLVARDVDDYIGRAVHLATDGAARRRLSEGLRERVAASPLCDAEQFTRALEDAFEAMLREVAVETS